jgi:hypothetical protein
MKTRSRAEVDTSSEARPQTASIEKKDQDSPDKLSMNPILVRDDFGGYISQNKYTKPAKDQGNQPGHQ